MSKIAQWGAESEDEPAPAASAQMPEQLPPQPAQPPQSNPWDGKTVTFNGEKHPMTEHDWNEIQTLKNQAAQLRAAGRTSGHFMPDGNGGWKLQPEDGVQAAPSGAAVSQTPTPAPPPAPQQTPPPPTTPTPPPATPTAIAPQLPSTAQAQPAPQPPQQPSAPSAQPAPQPPQQPSAPSAQPAAAPQPQQTPPQTQQPQNRRGSMWDGMNDQQKNSFRQWAQRDGRGKTFGAMFRGADGKVDREAYDRFIAENPSLLTGTDAERDAVLKKRYGQLDQGQKDSFHQSKEYMDYRASALARRQKRQDAAMDNVQNQYDKMKSYDDRQRAIAADPIGATSVKQVSGFHDIGKDIDTINNAGRHVDTVKDFGVTYDHRTGKTYRIVNGKMQESQGGGQTPAAGVVPRPVTYARRGNVPTMKDTAGGLPKTMVADQRRPVPQLGRTPGITTFRGGRPGRRIGS